MINKHKKVPRNHYSKRQKSIAWACLFLQFLPVITSVSAVIPAVALASEQHMLPRPKAAQKESGVNPFEKQVASGAVALGKTLSDEDRTSSEALSDYARAQATNAVNSSAEAWLSQFGTASVQLSLEQHGKLGDSSIDWLLPLYDSPKNLLFTQLGMRHKDDRNTVNIGVGSRFFLQDNWMLGLNTFVDSDITGRNYRLGMGAEAWSDYLKLSANGYRRLSDWHQSRDFEDYDERPANGFDLRMNGFLPAYPQLGATLVYEQYFGDEVALFGKDNRQKDPYAVTVGANYTPVPMLTFSAEQRMGKGDQSELNLALDMTWQLDKSLSENLSPDAVDEMRKLSHSRYDLVERNNDIVLEYRKQQVIRLTLSPEQITGPAGSLQRVTSVVKAKHGVKNVQWQGASFTAAGGVIAPLSPGLYQLTLPAWQMGPGVSQAAQGARKQNDASRLLNTYVLTATAEDNNGNFSRPEQLTVEVLPPVAHFMGDATVQGDYAPPDGSTAVNVQYLVVNGDSQPLSGENVDFDITYVDGKHAAQKTSSDDKGRAVLALTSTLAGEANVSARLGNGETSDVTVHYADAQPDASHSSFNAAPATLAANGKDISTLTLMLQDSLARPVTGLTNISFVATGVTGTTLSKVSETSAGNYVATLSGTVAGDVTVTPQLDGKPLSDMSAHITLAGDNKSAHIAPGDMTVTTNNAMADGVSQNMIAVKVTDDQGNPIAGQAVTFSADNGATIEQTGTTDSNGLLSMPVVSVTAGTSTVTATVNGQSQSVAVSFIADNSSAQIAAGDLVVLADGAKANATATNQIQVKVTDSQGNILPDIPVKFTASNGAVIAASGMTGADGTVQLPVTSAKAGISTITATLNNSTQSVNTTFVADSDTATIAAGDLTVITNNALANGVKANKVQVKITDANGNPVAGQDVNFTATNGATLAATATSDVQGLIQLPVTSKIAGSSTITATLNGTSQNVDLNFSADGSTAQIASGALTVQADGAVANGTATNRVQVKVTDANGNPLTGQNVTFSASNGATIASSGTTGADGTVTLPVTSMTAGVSTVSASINSSQQTVSVNFVADGSTAEIASGALTVTTDNALANGSAANQIQVMVTDAGGNTVSGEAVTFSASNGATVATSATTDGSGRIQLPVTSKTAGLSVLTATVNGSTAKANMHFTADGSTAQIASGALTVTADNSVANGSSSNEVQVIVTDANGNTLAGQNVTFSASNGAIIAGSGTTGSDGSLKMPVTSTLAGVSTVKATVNGSSQSVDVTFVADSSTANITSGNLSVVNDNAVANGTANNKVQVKVTDAKGNPVAGETVSFRANNGATIAASGSTAADGTLSMTLTSLKAGVSTVTATVNGSSQQVNVTFVADASTAEILSSNMTVTTNNAIADATSSNSVRVVVTDANGNRLAAQTVDFSATNGATVAAQASTDTNGEIDAAITSTTAGDSVIEAKINGKTQQVTVTFQPDGSSAHFVTGSLVILKDNALANGSDTDQLQATVVDNYDNPIPDTVVSLRANNGATINNKGTTDASGKLTATLSNTNAGATTVTATINGGDHAAEVMFVADSSTATVTAGDVKVVNDNAVADGLASNQVQVKVTDANGNAVDGESVSFSASNGATVAASGTTDVDGMLTVPVTSLTAGSSTVKVTVNGTSQSVNMTFVADASTAEIASGNLTLINDNAIANGSASNGVKVLVTDKQGNPVSGQTVNFSASNGASIAATGTTNTSGSVTMSVTSLTAGVSTVKATVNGSSQQLDLTFVADGGTAQIAAGNMTVTANNAVADGKTINSVQVKVTDANGNPLTGQNVTFSASNGATIASSGTTGADGTVTLPVTSMTAGDSTITASINSSQQTASVTFVADGSTAEIASGALTVTTDNAVADGSAANQIQVVVTDAGGNTVSGETVAFSASNGATVAASAITDGSGRIQLPVTSKTAGISVLTATVNGSTAKANMHFTADGSTAQIASGALTVTADNAVANGSSSNEVQVIVTDTNGNTLAGQNVTFSASNGATIAASGTTGSDGSLKMPVTSTVAGVSTVKATVNGSSQSADVTFVADSSTAQIVAGNLTALTDNAIANGTASNDVQVKVTDANGNVVKGQSVSFSADNGATIAASGTTDANGLVQMAVTSVTAGKSVVRATVNGNSQQVDVTFVADASTAEIVSSNMTITANNAGSDGTSANGVRVVVTDANGNLLVGQTVNFSATNGATIAAQGDTDATGAIEEAITSTTAGDSVIEAEVNGNKQQVTVTFLADGDSAHFATSSLVILKDNALANGSDTNQLQATVVDNYDNPIPDLVVTLRASNGATVNAQSTTDANGKIKATLSNTTAGTTTVTATVNGGDHSANVTFVADSSTATVTAGNVSVLNDNAVANGLASNQVQVKVTDANGNAVGGQNVSFSASNGATVTATGTTDDDGMLTVPVTSLKAGSSTVKVTVNGSSQSVSMTFVADASTAEIASGKLTVFANRAAANGSMANAVKVIVTDKQGNPVSDQVVSFSASNGASIGATGTTSTSGSIMMSVTSLTAGISTITATVNGSSQQVDMTFVADASTAQIASGDMTVTANNAVADGTATNSVQVKVTDVNGNPVDGVSVGFMADNGAVIAASALSDVNGQITLPVSSVVAGNSTVKATVKGSSQSVTVKFVADDSTAQVADGSLRVTTDNAVANGVSANKVQVTVTDANGNALSGQTVTLSASNGAAIAATAVTATDGTVEVPVTSLEAGDSTIKASINGSNQTVTITFVADDNTAEIASGALTVTADNAVANNSASNEVQVIVTDANGNVLAGQDVAFSASNGATIAASGTTGSDGSLKMPVTSTLAGVSTVKATVNGGSQSVDVTFVADSSTATITAGNLSVVNDNAVANGTASNDVQVKVTDANGNVVVGQSVSFSADNGATLATSGTTDANGLVPMAVTSVTAGKSKVTATVNGNSQQVDVTFVADASTAEILSSNMTVTTNNAIANAASSNGVRVVVTDANGNLLVGQTVNFSATNGATIAAQGVTDTSGAIDAAITSTIAGDSVIEAKINGKTQQVTVTFLPDRDSAHFAIGSLVTLKDNALANGTDTNQLQVTVVDDYDNPIPDTVVALRASNGATINAQSTTDAEGKMLATLSNTTAGTTTVTATINGSDHSAAVTFVADSSTATVTAGNVSVLNDNAVANGLASNQVQVKVTDATGNAVGGESVSFSASNGATVAATGTTNDDGMLTVPVTSLTAGSSTVKVTVNGSSQSVSMTFVADASTAEIASGNFTVVTDNAIADGSAADVVKVQVTDKQGNPVSSQVVSFSASNGASIAAMGTTDASGSLTVPVTSLTAGVSTVKATVNGSSQQLDLTFVADGGTAQIVAGDMTVTANNAVADGTATNSVQVKVTDANGNPIDGMSVDFTADNGAVIAASAKSDVDGQITLPVSSVVAGNSTVKATVNGSSQSVTVKFVADSSTAQVAGGNLIVTTDNAVANGVSANKVQVTVTDANGNALSGQTVTLSASNGAAIAASAVTTTDGTAQIPLTSLKAGDSTVTASINGSNQTVTVTFVADDNTAQIASGALTVTADNAVANNSASNEVQVIVTDANGNVIAGQDVAFIASNGATITASGTTGSDGSLKMPVTSTVAGVSTVKATVNGSSQSVDVTFVADSSTAQIAAGNLTALTDNAIANGTASNDVQVKVTDAWGNVIEGQSVSFSADNGATIAASGTTDADGLVLMAVTNLKAGKSTVTATVNGSSQNLAITFIADSSTATITSADFVLLNDGAKANGSDPDVVQVTVKDANGNAVPGQAVSFSADNSATIKASETTDANGMAAVAVTSTLAGSSTVTASTNGSSQAVVASFVADSSTAQIQASDIVVTENGALANGVAENKVMVKVTDANNNVVGGVDVAFSITGIAAITATATTGADGVVTVPMHTNQSGDHQVTATINGSSQNVVVNFIAATIPVITDVVDNVAANTGSILSGQITNDPQPVLSGTADPNAVVRLFDGDTMLTYTHADDDGLWSIKPASAISGEGNHTLTLTAALTISSDQSPKSAAFILNLDTIAQVPTIDSVTDSNGPVPQGGTTNGDSVTLTGTTEPGATVTIIGIRLADRIMTALGSIEVGDDGHWQFTVTDMRAFQDTGEYQFTAKTTDIAGNSSKTSAVDPWAVQYESWPAPLGTPEYTLTASGESVDQTQATSLLSSTGNALFISQISGGINGSIDLPAASAANSGNRVYVSIEGSVQCALRANGKTLKALSKGSQTTWYSNGSTWKQIY